MNFSRQMTATGLFLGLACGPETNTIEQLEEKCAKKCSLALACEMDPDPKNVERCENGCHEDADLSLEIGDECAESYDKLITCISELDCAGWDAWVFMRPPRPCETETNNLSICPGVWFVPGP